jgi:hypothetical protein
LGNAPPTTCCNCSVSSGLGAVFFLVGLEVGNLADGTILVTKWLTTWRAAFMLAPEDEKNCAKPHSYFTYAQERV